MRDGSRWLRASARYHRNGSPCGLHPGEFVNKSKNAKTKGSRSSTFAQNTWFWRIFGDSFLEQIDLFTSSKGCQNAHRRTPASGTPPGCGDSSRIVSGGVGRWPQPPATFWHSFGVILESPRNGAELLLATAFRRWFGLTKNLNQPGFSRLSSNSKWA